MRKYLFAMAPAALAMLCTVLFGGEAVAQRRSVIQGLEGHGEYLGLVNEEGYLVARVDSLSQAIGLLRGELRADTLGREAKSEVILRLEQESFGVRNRMARVAGQINAIEQEWILQNLHTELSASEADEADDADGAGGFESNLSAEQLAELRQARESEPEMPGLVARYIDNHRRIGALADEYESASTATLADSVRTEFEIAALENARLDETIGKKWEAIFDSKGYIYNLLAEKQNRADMLALWEGGMERMRQQQSEQTRRYASESIARYLLQKRMLTEYEIVLADEFGNGQAADSLRRAVAALPRPDALEELQPVVLKERLFFDYADVEVGGSPYNASNPIPEVQVFSRGMVYRVLVGSFSSPQSPSVFRGAWPLAVQKGEDGRYRYFAGGFPTESPADAATERLRGAGFRAPAVVVWADGVYIEPRDGGDEDAEKDYRIEISSPADLTPGTRNIIESIAGVGAIVKSESGFVVAPLDAGAALQLRSALETQAEEVQEEAGENALRETGAGMTIRLAKISGRM